MSTREDFEAWAISVQLSTTRYEALGSYAFYETRKAWDAYQAATSRQEAKIKALVEALETCKIYKYDSDDKGEKSFDEKLVAEAIAAAKETP